MPSILGLNLGVAFFLAISRLRDQGLDKQAYYPAVGVLALLFAHVVRSALEVREEYFRDRESEDGQDVVSTSLLGKATKQRLLP